MVKTQALSPAYEAVSGSSFRQPKGEIESRGGGALEPFGLEAAEHAKILGRRRTNW
jgi:hypothetical protein